MQSTWQLAIKNLDKVEYNRPRYESCPYCARLFVKQINSQKYCTPACGTAQRNINLSLRNQSKK
jgi:hypothetical protein